MCVFMFSWNYRYRLIGSSLLYLYSKNIFWYILYLLNQQKILYRMHLLPWKPESVTYFHKNLLTFCLRFIRLEIILNVPNTVNVLRKIFVCILYILALFHARIQAFIKGCHSKIALWTLYVLEAYQKLHRLM